MGTILLLASLLGIVASLGPLAERYGVDSRNLGDWRRPID